MPSLSKFFFFTPLTITQITSPSKQNPLTVSTTINWCDSHSPNNSCHLKKKIIVPPKSTVYVPAVSSFLSTDTELFEPKTQELFIFSYQSIVITDATTKSKSNRNPDIQISVSITNNSDVHIIKNTILGLIQDI